MTALAFEHLLTVRVDEPEPASSAPGGRKEVDLKGTIRVVGAVPGLFALILFSTFNNFLGGVFMALMDAYGLSLMEVQAWGLLAGAGLVLVHPPRADDREDRSWARTAAHVARGQSDRVDGGERVHGAVLDRAARGGLCSIWLFLGPYAEAGEQTDAAEGRAPTSGRAACSASRSRSSRPASPLTAFLVGPAERSSWRSRS